MEIQIGLSHLTPAIHLFNIITRNAKENIDMDAMFSLAVQRYLIKDNFRALL
jgi:hypothetical protein